MFYTIFTICLLASVFFLLYITKRGRNEPLLDKIIKLMTVLYLALAFLDVFLPDYFMCSLELDALAKIEGGKFHAILRWANYVCFTVLPIAVFQKNKYFEKIASFFCLPVAIVNVACFYQYLPYFTSRGGGGLRNVLILSDSFKDFLLNDVFRAIFFGATCLFQLLALLMLTLRNAKKLAVAKDEILNLALIFLGVTYMSLPIFVPQYLFGHVDIMMTRFSITHILWIVGIAAIIVALYFIFRNRSYEARYLLVLSMSWALLMQFSQMFSASSNLNVMKLPLQLCNLGSYFALLMLLKKSEKLYNFALIVNVVGAVVAIIILDIGADISHLSRLWVVHYIVEHTKVLVVPILCLVLKIFKPLSMKSLKYFSLGFLIYYAVVFAVGTVSNGFGRIFANESFASFFYANHLFMFDKEIARGLVGFTDPLFDMKIALGPFEIYPAVQLLVLAVFMLLCTGVFFLFYGLTKNQRKAEKLIEE